MKSVPRFLLVLLLPRLLCAQAKHTPTLDETVSLKTFRKDSPLYGSSEMETGK